MIHYYKHAIDIEVFLQLYFDWQKGKYKSSRGLINISEMNDAHLINAIADLTKRRDARAAVIETLIPDYTNDIVGVAKATYNDHEDLLSLKLEELEQEAVNRSKAKK